MTAPRSSLSEPTVQDFSWSDLNPDAKAVGIDQVRVASVGLASLAQQGKFMKRKIVVIGANQVPGEAGEWATPVWTQQACH